MKTAYIWDAVESAVFLETEADLVEGEVGKFPVVVVDVRASD